jgi:hypothetical protein
MRPTSTPRRSASAFASRGFISLGLVMCFPDFSVIYYVDRRTRAGPLRDEVSRAAFT